MRRTSRPGPGDFFGVVAQSQHHHSYAGLHAASKQQSGQRKCDAPHPKHGVSYGWPWAAPRLVWSPTLRASDHAAHENGHTDGGADLPAGQQLGPPQARKTGSFLTEAIIATPAPIASASKTKISAVIFTIPPDNDHEHELSARWSETASFGLF